MKLSRRQAIVLMGITSLSGCAKAAVRSAGKASKGSDEGLSNGAAAGDDIADHFSNTETEEPSSAIGSFFAPVTLVDTDLSIQSGSYNYWELNYSKLLDSDATHVNLEYEVLVRSGGPVDVVLQSPTEFDYFSKGERSRYYTEASSLRTTDAAGEFELPLDDFVMVVDNSSRSVAEAHGAVDVSVQITGTPEE